MQYRKKPTNQLYFHRKNMKMSFKHYSSITANDESNVHTTPVIWRFLSSPRPLEMNAAAWRHLISCTHVPTTPAKGLPGSFVISARSQINRDQWADETAARLNGIERRGRNQNLSTGARGIRERIRQTFPGNYRRNGHAAVRNEIFAKDRASGIAHISSL